MLLWVLWRLPRTEVPRDAMVLSFLLPADEERLAAAGVTRIHRGREAVQHQRAEARRVLHEVIAKLGVAELRPGCTLRQAMARDGEASGWWYHHVALRDSEGGHHFNWIAQVLTLLRVAKDVGAERVALYGAPREVAAVTASQLALEQPEGREATGSEIRRRLWGIGSRIRHTMTMLDHCRALRSHYQLPKGPFRLAISTFWDWGVRWDEKSGGYADRYFRRLPARLSAAGVEFGYFAWFDPHYEPAQQGRSLEQVLSPLAGQSRVVLLQAFLRPTDILREAFDFSACRALRQFLRAPAAGGAFVVDRLDWRPLLEPELWRGVRNAQIANCRLVALATQRAAERYGPRLSLGFLEHFPYARAHYAGMRRGAPKAVNCTMQHAGCARDKTFYHLDAARELRGEPDGERVPQPDRVFVMGEFGAAVFRACGYAEKRIVLTGSARYDHVVYPSGPVPRASRVAGPLRVLVACSLEVSCEIAMVEAAVLAKAGSPTIELRVRNHPSSRVDAHPRFAALQASVEISQGTLEADIAWADVLLYSYSTVAEEAFLQGRPAWQWLPLGFNGSALAEVADIPRFGSVAALGAAFREGATQAPATVPPSASADAARQLFHPGDGQAAERIAAYCRDLCA